VTVAFLSAMVKIQRNEEVAQGDKNSAVAVLFLMLAGMWYVVLDAAR
jgi:hypothetical protein